MAPEVTWHSRPISPAFMRWSVARRRVRSTSSSQYSSTPVAARFDRTARSRCCEHRRRRMAIDFVVTSSCGFWPSPRRPRCPIDLVFQCSGGHGEPYFLNVERVDRSLKIEYLHIKVIGSLPRRTTRGPHSPSSATPRNQGHPDHLLRGPVHGRARCGHRERGTAPDAGQSGLSVAGQAVGGERLHADVRRLPDAGRPGRRPLRSPSGVPDRPRGVHRLQPDRRPRPEWELADRRTGGTGHRRRHPRPGHPEHPGDHLHRPGRTAAGSGRLVGDGCQRSRRGRPGRRDPDQPPQLAVGALRERPRWGSC